MNMTKYMLDLVMDGIKDTDMIARYAEEAHKVHEHKSTADWFATRAKARLSHLERDWKDVWEELEEHGKHDEELMDALACHINHSIAGLKTRIDKM